MLAYACTIFLSAFLLFAVQPMIGKIILPWFGGSAAVWSTRLLFFQAALLAGYLYAHRSTRSLKPKQQATLHIVEHGGCGWDSDPTGGELKTTATGPALCDMACLSARAFPGPARPLSGTRLGRWRPS